MTSQPNYITPPGFKKLQDELAGLLHKERPDIVKIVTWAASLGDRSENADYIYGKRRLREIDRRIRFLQQRLEAAQIVDPRMQSGTAVTFGATVSLVDEDGVAQTYRIVGSDEIDPQNGAVSWQSPLAKTLLGKKEGDVVILRRPKGEKELEIIKVEYS